MTSDINFAVALLTVRLIAGILFLFQGYDKIFKIGMKEVRTMMTASFGNSNIPGFAIAIIAPLTSWIELVCGLLLVIGLFKYYAIYLLCIDLLIVAVGLSISKPMWENNHVFIRLLLMIFLLITPVEWDRFSMDYLLALSKFSI